MPGQPFAAKVCFLCPGQVSAMPVRYRIAILAAALIVAGGAAFCAQTRRAVLASVREGIERVERTPENAPDLDAALRSLDTGRIPEEFGLEVPPSLMWRIMLSDLLRVFWPLWAGLTLAVCFGAAWVLGRGTVEPIRPDSAPAPPAGQGPESGPAR